MSQFIKTQEAGTLQSLGWARNIKFSQAVTWCTIPTINLSQPVGAYTYYDENEDRCEGLSLCYQAAVYSWWMCHAGMVVSERVWTMQTQLPPQRVRNQVRMKVTYSSGGRTGNLTQTLITKRYIY